MNKEQIAELMYQAQRVETATFRGAETFAVTTVAYLAVSGVITLIGVLYQLRCAVNEDLREEWEEYLEQTQQHVEIVEGLFETFGLDPETESPGRLVVRHIGESLVKAMEMAMDAGNADAAQIVAAECIALAET